MLAWQLAMKLLSGALRHPGWRPHVDRWTDDSSAFVHRRSSEIIVLNPQDMRTSAMSKPRNSGYIIETVEAMVEPVFVTHTESRVHDQMSNIWVRPSRSM